MKPQLICASVVSADSLSEYLILKETIELFYSVTWFIASDKPVHDALKINSNINCYPVIHQPPGTHGSKNIKENSLHMSLMMKKFSACHRALLLHDYVLLLDSDMIFCSPLPEKLYIQITQPCVDVIVSPHCTEDYELESKVGRYNGGMICVKSVDFLNKWLQLSLKYSENNWYYEQQPIEYAAQEYLTTQFPIYCNIGWWRMNNIKTRKRFESLELIDNQIYFLSQKAVCFHLHTLKRLPYSNYGAFLAERLIEIMLYSSAPVHKAILNIMSTVISNSWLSI